MEKMYVTPELEVLNVMVEQGFAGSFQAGDSNGEDAPDLF